MKRLHVPGFVLIAGKYEIPFPISVEGSHTNANARYIQRRLVKTMLFGQKE